MSARTKPAAAPAEPAAWTLRDEFAMRAMAAMVIAGGWGDKDVHGTIKKYADMCDYSRAAYKFADFMLDAREAA